ETGDRADDLADCGMMPTAFSAAVRSTPTGATRRPMRSSMCLSPAPRSRQVEDHIRLAKLQNTSTDDKSRDALLHSCIRASHVRRCSARRTLARAYGCKRRDHPIQCDKLRERTCLMVASLRLFLSQPQPVDRARGRATIATSYLE